MLNTLHLRDNSIGDIGVRALAVALKVNTALATLDLRYNSIGDSGARALATMLEVNGALATLDLMGNPINDAAKSLVMAAHRSPREKVRDEL